VSGEQPRVFLSHAGEDKGSFAEPLARALAVLGVRAWLDRWEIQPGDSLVQKLFDEGLARAHAVVIIVSASSVAKPWVREELDAATVSRITQGTRLIPVRLDGAAMPAPLQHLLWLDADRDEAGVEQVARRIADLLHGRDPRPAVAPVPDYASSHPIPGLSAADASLLVEIARQAVEQRQWIALDWVAVRGRAHSAGLGDAAMWESAEALAHADLIDVTGRSAATVRRLDLTTTGWHSVAPAILGDPAATRRAVAAALVNDPPNGTRIVDEIAERLGVQHLAVDAVLRDLEAEGLVGLSRALGGHVRLHRVSPLLARQLS